MAVQGMQKQTTQATPVKIKAGLVYVVGVMAVVFGVLILVFQIMITGLEAMMGIILMGIGLGIGAVSVFMPPQKVMTVSEIAERKGPTIKEILFGVSLVMFVIGLVLQPPITTKGIDVLISGGISSFMSLLFVILIGFSFLMYIEMATMSFRFGRIKQYAELQGLKELELNSAIMGNMGSSMIAGAITMGIIALIFLIMKVIWDFAPTLVRKSIEFNSIYGLVITSALIFGLIAIIYSFIFGWESYQRTIRAFRRGEVSEEEEEAELTETLE